LVHQQPHAALDEFGHALHHTDSTPFAAHKDGDIIGITYKAVTATAQLLVQFVQYDIAQERRQGTTLRHSLFRSYKNPIGQQHRAFQQASKQDQQFAVLDLLPHSRHETLVVHTIEEFRQIKIHHHMVAGFYVLAGFG
jgi:hypothetical protein